MKVVVFFAASCLVFSQGGADREMTNLLRKLKSNDVEERRGASTELSVLASTEQKRVLSALDALIDALGDTDSRVRYDVCITLMKLAPTEIGGKKKLLPALARMVEQDSLENAIFAAHVMAQFPKPAVKILKTKLGEVDGDNRSAVIAALRWMGGDAEDAIGELEKLSRTIGDQNTGKRLGLGQALVCISSNNKVGIDILQSYTKEPGDRFRHDATFFLARSTANKSVIPVLKEIIDDPLSDRLMAIQAIWEARENASSLKVALKQMLDGSPKDNGINRNEHVYCYCAATVFYLNPDDKGARSYLTERKDVLIQMLKKPYHEELRYFACVTVGELKVRESLQILRSMSENDPSRRVRMGAKNSLAQMKK